MQRSVRTDTTTGSHGAGDAPAMSPVAAKGKNVASRGEVDSPPRLNPVPDSTSVVEHAVVSSGEYEGRFSLSSQTIRERKQFQKIL